MNTGVMGGASTSGTLRGWARQNSRCNGGPTTLVSDGVSPLCLAASKDREYRGSWLGGADRRLRYLSRFRRDHLPEISGLLVHRPGVQRIRLVIQRRETLDLFEDLQEWALLLLSLGEYVSKQMQAADLLEIILLVSTPRSWQKETKSRAGSMGQIANASWSRRNRSRAEWSIKSGPPCRSFSTPVGCTHGARGHVSPASARIPLKNGAGSAESIATNLHLLHRTRNESEAAGTGRFESAACMVRRYEARRLSMSESSEVKTVAKDSL